MSTVAGIVAEISANTAKFTSGINEVNRLLGTLDKNTKGIRNSVDKQTSAMSKSWFNVAGAIYTVRSAYQVLERAFSLTMGKGIQAVEEYKQGMITAAAVTLQVMDKKSYDTMADGWQIAERYASAMVPVLEKIAVETALTGVETQKMFAQFAKHGVLLDATNEKAVAGFKAIGNAIYIMTKGQGLEKQLLTEINALMEGEARQGAVIFDLLNKQIPNLKEQLKIWKATDTVFQNLLPYLTGFDAASKKIQFTWEGMKSTLKTTVDQVLRAGFEGSYENIIKKAFELNEWLVKHKQQLSEIARIFSETFVAAIEKIGKAVFNISSNMATVLAPFTERGKSLQELEAIEKKIAWLKKRASDGGNLVDKLFGHADYENQIRQLEQQAIAIKKKILVHAEPGKFMAELIKPPPTNKTADAVKEVGKSAKDLAKINEWAYTEIEKYSAKVAEVMEEPARVAKWMFDEITEYSNKGADIIRGLNKELGEQVRQAYELLESELMKAPEKTFSEGLSEGMDDYVKDLKYNFDRGKEIAQEAMQSMQGFFEDIFVGKVKLSFKSLMEWIGGLWAKMLAEMAATALAKPIIMPVIQMAMGAGASIAGGIGSIFGMGGAAEALGFDKLAEATKENTSALSSLSTALGMDSGGLSSVLGTIGSLLPAGIAGYGVGKLVGNGSTGSAIGGVAGGVAGYMAGSSTAVIMAATNLLGGSMPAIIGTTVLPIIGTVIGAAIGALAGGLLGGKQEPPQTRLKFSEETGWKVTNARKMGGEATTNMVSNIMSNLQNTLSDYLEAIGGDLSKLQETWKGKKTDIDNVKDLLNKWVLGYTKFITGLKKKDFKQYQKDDEKLYDTIFRIMQAVSTLPKRIQNVEMFINVIKGSADDVAIWTQNIIDMNDQIDNALKSLALMTDPSDMIEYAEQVKQLIVEKYQAEIEMVNKLRDEIDSTTIEMQDFQSKISRRIAELSGTSDQIIGASNAAMQTAMDRMNAANDPIQKLDYFNDYMDALDQWTDDNLAAIEDFYSIQQDSINSQIEALQEQISLSEQWASISKSAKAMMLELKTSLSSPEEVMTRLGIAQGEVSRIQGLYQGATGTQKAEYAGDLQDALKSYLSVAQEAYQRPSAEYQAIWSNVLGVLDTIQTDASTFQVDETGILEQISTLQGELTAINQAMADDIKAFKEEALAYYQWAEEFGSQLYLDKITSLEEKLSGILGDKSIEQFIAEKQNEAVLQLIDIKQILTDLLNEFAEKSGTTPIDIDANIKVEVPENDFSDKRLASTIEDAMMVSILRGKLRQAVKEVAGV